jgi:hypothetical protein
MQVFKYLIFVVLFYIPQAKGLSQILNIKKRLYIESSYNYGFVAPHHDFMSYFITDHVRGYQVNVGIHTFGDKPWHRYFNYPDLGLGFYHSGLGNNLVYGKMNALYFYTDRMFLNKDNKVNFGNKISLGLSYINKCFNLYENNFDLAIGSKVNAFIRYEIEIVAQIGKQTQGKLGLGLTHTSNGNFRQPNKGLNIVSSLVSVQYSFSGQYKKVNPIKSTPDTCRHLFSIYTAFGYKALSRFSNSSYPVYALSVEYGHYISKTGCLGMALTGYKDLSLQKEQHIDSKYSASSWDNYRLVINLSYEMKMGKLGYVFQPGIYLKNSFRESGNLSNRTGLRYYFKNGLVTGVLIKAHWPAVADVIEWTIGYQLKK